MAILKHITSKNADYGEAQRYLMFQYDEAAMKPVLDESGRMIPREEYYLDGIPLLFPTIEEATLLALDAMVCVALAVPAAVFFPFFRCLVCLLILAFLPEFLQDSPFCLLCVFCRLSRCFSTGFLCCLMQKTACSFLKELGFLQTGISLMHSTACPVHRIPEGASRNGPACGTFSFSAYLLRCLLFFPRRSPPFFWSTAGASIS